MFYDIKDMKKEKMFWVKRDSSISIIVWINTHDNICAMFVSFVIFLFFSKVNNIIFMLTKCNTLYLCCSIKLANGKLTSSLLYLDITRGVCACMYIWWFQSKILTKVDMPLNAEMKPNMLPWIRVLYLYRQKNPCFYFILFIYLFFLISWFKIWPWKHFKEYKM